MKPFEEVRDELAEDVKTQRAESLFYDKANELGDKAFDAYDELASVATALKLPLKTLQGFARTGDSDTFRNSAPVVQAAFSDELVDSGRNSQLIELADDDALVLRVTAHHLPMTKPLDEVRDQIRDELVREQAAELAETAATTFLTAIEKGARPRRRGEGPERHVAPGRVGAAHRQRRAHRGAVGRLRHAQGRPGHGAAGPDRARQRRSGRDRPHERGGGGALEPARRPSATSARSSWRTRPPAPSSSAYVESVRQEATVRIPPEVLEPPAY